jgi:hypothetical protein
MTTPPGSNQNEPSGEHHRALAEFAEELELSFNDIQQSLTSPATAAAFLRTLDVLERALQGSQAGGIITAGQLAELEAVIDGMRQAIRLL